MSNHDVVFEEEGYQKQSRFKKNSDSKIINFVIKYSGGLIKNPTQANILLFIFVVLSLLLTFTTVASLGGPKEYPENIIVIPAV